MSALARLTKQDAQAMDCRQRLVTDLRAWLLSLMLAAAVAYIVQLRRELAAARSRGDMYRDIAASLDQKNAARVTPP